MKALARKSTKLCDKKLYLDHEAFGEFHGHA